MRRAVNHWVIKAKAILQGPVESYQKTKSQVNSLWLKKHKAIKSLNWRDSPCYFRWHSGVAAALLRELGGGASWWMLLYKEKDNLNIFVLCTASWKLNCDDKDQAIVLKHWTLREIIAQVLNSYFSLLDKGRIWLSPESVQLERRSIRHCMTCGQSSLWWREPAGQLSNVEGQWGPCVSRRGKFLRIRIEVAKGWGSG